MVIMNSWQSQCCHGSKTKLSAQYLWGLGHHLYPQTGPRIPSPLSHVTHGLGTKRAQSHNSLKTLEMMSLDKMYTSQRTQCSSTSLSQSSPPSWFSCPFIPTFMVFLSFPSNHLASLFTKKAQVLNSCCFWILRDFLTVLLGKIKPPH